MNIYIAEDDMNVINILRRIITDRNLGNVVGFAMDGISAKKEILELNVDIVLSDLLMPYKDGIHLVKEIKELKHDIEFIMISQVSSKDMIGKAYQFGVEYYVYKPINALEIENILKKVSEKINLKRAINQIQRLVKVDNIKPRKVKNGKNKIEGKINRIMKKIGIIGEVGNQDIIDVVNYLVKNNKTMNDFTITELLANFTDQTKSMEQRIRRTAAVGLINLANLGIEDYMNEIFIEYSNGLYSFEQVKIEMDYIRGKGRKRGKINLKKFLDGMVFYSIEE